MIDASPTMTVARLSRVIAAQTGVPRGSFALYHGSKPMNGTLKDSGVASGSTVELKFRGRGGGPEPQARSTATASATHSMEVELESGVETQPRSSELQQADEELPARNRQERKTRKTAFEATKVMRKYDQDGDGKCTQDEMHAMALDYVKEKKTRRLATKAAIAMGVVILLVVCLNAGLTAAIVFLSKDVQVSNNGLLSANSNVAKVAVAKQTIPLGLASYMTHAELMSIDKVMISKNLFNATDFTMTPYSASYTVLGYEWTSHHDMFAGAR